MVDALFFPMKFNKRTEKVKEIEDKINSLGKLYSFILSKESNI